MNFGTVDAAVKAGWITDEAAKASGLTGATLGAWGAGELFDDVDSFEQNELGVEPRTLAGATVLASDLPAFRKVLGDGKYGVLFPTVDVDELAAELAGLLADPGGRAALDAEAQQAVRRYDWSTVATQVLQVYETVTTGGPR